MPKNIKEVINGKTFYKKRWRSKDLEIYMPKVPEKIEAPEIDEEKLYIQESICSTFGCNKKLNFWQKKYSDKCIDCMNKKKNDLTLVLIGKF